MNQLRRETLPFHQLSGDAGKRDRDASTRVWTGIICALGIWLPACGAQRIPDRVLEKLPYESRIELLEAENELALAVDHLDEARSEVGRTKETIKRAKDRRSSAKREVSDAKDPSSRQVAELAVQEADARVEYLRARQKVNVANEGMQELELRCARERFELARLMVARKAKVKGSEGLKPGSFEQQVKRCESEVAQGLKESKEKGQKADLAKAEWEKSRGVLARKTFDARASPYVE